MCQSNSTALAGNHYFLWFPMQSYHVFPFLTTASSFQLLRAQVWSPLSFSPPTGFSCQYSLFLTQAPDQSFKTMRWILSLPGSKILHAFPLLSEQRQESVCGPEGHGTSYLRGDPQHCLLLTPLQPPCWTVSMLGSLFCPCFSSWCSLCL